MSCCLGMLVPLSVLIGTITLFAPCAVTLPTEDSILGVLRQGTDVVTASEVETRETVLASKTCEWNQMGGGRDCKHGAYKCDTATSLSDAQAICAADSKCGGVSVGPGSRPRYCLKHPKTRCDVDYGNSYVFYAKGSCGTTAGPTATMLCRAAYPQTLTWMKVGGKSIYTDTAEQCLEQVMKHCPQKKYFVHSSEKKNNCPSDCAALTGSGRWDGKCGDCAGCGCVSAAVIETPCPTQQSGNWRNNCGGTNAWSCHRMGHTHTYSITGAAQGPTSVKVTMSDFQNDDCFVGNDAQYHTAVADNSRLNNVVFCQKTQKDGATAAAAAVFTLHGARTDKTGTGIKISTGGKYCGLKYHNRNGRGDGRFRIVCDVSEGQAEGFNIAKVGSAYSLQDSSGSFCEMGWGIRCRFRRSVTRGGKFNFRVAGPPPPPTQAPTHIPIQVTRAPTHSPTHMPIKVTRAPTRSPTQASPSPTYATPTPTGFPNHDSETKCEDDHAGVQQASGGQVTDCAAVATRCDDSMIGPMVRKHCPKTCGMCGSPTPPPTKEPTAVHDGEAHCVDDHAGAQQASNGVITDCRAVQERCNDSMIGPMVQKHCPKTCGKCGSPPPPSATGFPTLATDGQTKCEDDHAGAQQASGGQITDCAAVETRCDDSMIGPMVRKHCPKTCGMCGSPTPPPTKEPTAVHDGKAHCVDDHAGAQQASNGMVTDCRAVETRCNDSMIGPMVQKHCPLTCNKCQPTVG